MWWRLKSPASLLFTQPFIQARRSKKTSKLRATGLSVGNSPVTGELPAQRTSTLENVSIWWRHHALWPSDATCLGRTWSLLLQVCCRRETITRINADLSIWTKQNSEFESNYGNLHLRKVFLIPSEKCWSFCSVLNVLTYIFLDEHPGLLLLTWYNFKPSMDK